MSQFYIPKSFEQQLSERPDLAAQQARFSEGLQSYVRTLCAEVLTELEDSAPSAAGLGRLKTDDRQPR